MADEIRQRADDRIPDLTVRVALIERSILVLLFVGLFVGVLAIVKPFTTAILFGAALATAAWPLRQALVRHRLGHGAAAALLLRVVVVRARAGTQGWRNRLLLLDSRCRGNDDFCSDPSQEA